MKLIILYFTEYILMRNVILYNISKLNRIQNDGNYILYMKGKVMKNKYNLLYFTLFVSIFILYYFVNNYKEQSINFQQKVLVSQAKTHFDNQVNTRHWNSNFGGVYVKPIEGLTPNPYLLNNTLKVNDELTLIKINPAWMTRQLSELSKSKDFSFKITSLTPLNPSNKVTKFEKKALEYMKETKQLEYYEITKDNNFNYIGALITEESCLECHAHQGYKVGDIRGGISVSLGTSEYKAVLSSIQEQSFVIKLIIFLSLISITVLIHLQFKNNDNLQLKIIERTEELENEKNYIHKILDANPDVILVINGVKIIDGNKGFFSFFKFNNLVEFLEKHSCISDYFITLDEVPFPKCRKVEDLYWPEYIVTHSSANHVIKLKKEDEIFYFYVNAVKLNENEDILVIMTDITDIKQKDKLLNEQSKMVSMGEMIGNIAHQWRQPLSVITTASTGIIMQKEYGLLDEDKLIDTCNAINNQAQYLSKTIDDFRNFIKGDRIKTIFRLKDDLNSFFHLIEGSVKSNDIELIFDINNDIKINGYENELVQCFINIFNNAKDSLKENVKNNRFIFISTSIEKNDAIIKIKDNAGGITEDILPKIFEPYFTTKHQTQGTGLGLHMTYNLIVDGMGGTIKANNVTYKYDGKEYIGAEFTITLPLN